MRIRIHWCWVWPAYFIILALIGMPTAGGAEATVEDTSVWIDRDFEGVNTSVRFASNRLQLCVREGDLVTQWYEATLSVTERERLWTRFAGIGLDDLSPTYTAPNVPNFIRESDMLVIRVGSHGQKKQVHVQDRTSGPIKLIQFAAELEASAKSLGVPLRGSSRAILAIPLDFPLPGQKQSEAEVLRAGGVKFPTPSPRLLRNSEVQRALASLGWLSPANTQEMDLPDPAYFQWKGRDLQLQKLKVSLVSITPQSQLPQPNVSN